MHLHAAAALLAAALVFPGPAAALPARPDGPVADLAGILDGTTREAVDQVSRTVLKESGAVLVVATVPSLEGMTIEDYAARLFKAWGIGEKEKNNGVLLLVAPAERKVRIEVGYGLESLLPDGRCGEIIRTEIVPAFRRGTPAEGVLDGARAIGRAIPHNGESPHTATRKPSKDSELPTYLFGAVLLAVSAFVIGLAFGYNERGHTWALIVCLAGILPALYGMYLAWRLFTDFLWLIGLVSFGAGEHLGSGRVVRGPRGRSGGWTSGGFGGWSGGGGGGGGSFGGFGGGFSGGGGASGSW